MSTKAVNGPWKAGKPSDAIVSEGCGCDLSSAGDAGNKDSHEYYGGHLIAESVAQSHRPVIIAAPDLLAACKFAAKELQDGVLDDSEVLAVLETAIAKAGVEPK